MSSSSPPIGDHRPSGFSILKDSIKDLNQQIYAEVSQLVPSINQDTTDDDDSGSDVDIVFSGHGTGPSEQPVVMPAQPAACPKPTARQSTGQDGSDEQPGIQAEVELPSQPALGVVPGEVVLSFTRAQHKAQSEQDRKELMQALAEAGGEKDEPILAGLLSMQGWLSGAAGRLAQGQMTRRTAGDDDSSALAESLPNGEAERQRDEAAAAEAEGSFHALMSRPEQDVLAEEVAAAGLEDMPTMNLEDSISGIDLDGLLARLKRDGQGAPAAGEQADVQLEWNLPPPESLFISDDEDSMASSTLSADRHPAAPAGCHGKDEHVSSRSARVQGERPSRARVMRGRGRRGGRTGGRGLGGVDVSLQPAKELGRLKERSPPATVVLDLRQQTSGEENPGDLPSTHRQRTPSLASSSSSSSSDDGLEDFYASRRHRIEPQGAPAAAGSRAARPTGPGGRSRPRGGRGGRHGGRLYSRDGPRSEPESEAAPLPTTAQQAAEDSSSDGDSDAPAPVPFLRPSAEPVVVPGAEQEQAEAVEREQREAEEEALREEERQRRQTIAELKAAALAEEKEAAQLAAKKAREAEKARQQDAERRRQLEEEQHRAKLQAAQAQLHRTRQAQWLRAAAESSPAGSVPLTDPAVTFSSPFPQLPPHFQIQPERLVTVVVSISEDPHCLSTALAWALSEEALPGLPAFAVVSALLVPEFPASLAGWTQCRGPPTGMGRSRALFLALDTSESQQAFLAALSEKLKDQDALHGCHVLARAGTHGIHQAAKLHSHPVTDPDPSSEFAVALLNKDILHHAGQLPMTVQMMAENGLHVAGLKILYLSEGQATDLAHVSRHHPPALTPLAAVLVHGLDATGRLQTLRGPADPLLAISAEPGSLNARLASCLPEPPGPHSAPLATVSKDPSSGLFEMKLMFGGRLPASHMDSPPPGWSPDPSWLAHVAPGAPQEAWIVCPAETDEEVAVAAQVLEHIGRRGFRLVSLRRMGLPDKASEQLQGALYCAGAEGPPLLPAGRPMLAACVAGDAAATLVVAALSSRNEIFPGVMATPGPREAAAASEALKRVVEVPPAGSQLGALRRGKPQYDSSGHPEDGEDEGGSQVAVIALRASQLGLLGTALRELLRTAGGPLAEGSPVLDRLPPLQLLAARRVTALKEVAVPWFWAGHGPASRQRSQALHQPVVLALVSGLEASALLRELLVLEPTAGGRNALQQCMLAVCPGRVAAEVIARAYFSEQDLSAHQINAATESFSSARAPGVIGNGSHELGQKLMPTLFSEPEPEDTLIVIDGEAVCHGILSRVMRLSSKHGFALSGIEMVRVTQGNQAALGISQQQWRWRPGGTAETAVVVKLRRTNAVRNCVTMLVESSELLAMESFRETQAAGTAAACSTAPEWATGKGIVALAGGAFPSVPEHWFSLSVSETLPATRRVVRPSSGLEQTACLSVAGPLRLSPDNSSEGPGLADLADALDYLMDNGFTVSGLRLAESPMNQTSTGSRPNSAALTGAGPLLVLALSRDNGLGKLQILMQEARRVSRDRRGSMLAIKPQARVSESLTAAEKQLAFYFESLHMSATAIVAEAAPSQQGWDLSDLD